MKRAVKVYLEPEDTHRLETKAVEQGFIGRGNISRYIEKVAREPVVFLDANVKSILSVLNKKK